MLTKLARPTLLPCPACVCRDGVMDSLERFLLIASSDDVTQAIDFAALDRIAGGAQRTQVGGRHTPTSLMSHGGWPCLLPPAVRT